MMKASRILCLCAAAALPQLVWAGNTTDPQGLGIVNALLDYCAKIDARDSDSFRTLKVSLRHGVPDNVEHMAAYLKGYAATVDLLKGVSKSNATEGCATAAAAGKAPARHPTFGFEGREKVGVSAPTNGATEARPGASHGPALPVRSAR
jgi:hypothetical protein